MKTKSYPKDKKVPYYRFLKSSNLPSYKFNNKNLDIEAAIPACKDCFDS